MSTSAFSPLGANVVITTSAGASTSAQAIPGSGGDVAMCHNSGASIAFVKFGDSAVADATNTDIVLPPNSLLPFAIPVGVTHCKVFNTPGSTLVYVQRGSGM